jgi:hypothetical protein
MTGLFELMCLSGVVFTGVVMVVMVADVLARHR